MHCKRFVLCYIVIFFITAVNAENVESAEEKIVKKVISECVRSKSRLSCFSEKAALVLEQTMDWDVSLFGGLKLVRNSLQLDPTSGRSPNGFSRLINAIWNYLASHKLALDFSENSRKARGHLRGGDGYGGGYSGGGGKGDKSKKKEMQYAKYAFMVLLGIFGFTGPITMKTLGIIAAKALMASKVALIIVGSVALTKLFKKDHDIPVVKVHTIKLEDDGHDRLLRVSKYPQFMSHSFRVYRN